MIFDTHIKRFFTATMILLLLACAVQPAFASEPEQEEDIPERKKVGLVLSGGGAKGAAHISIIKMLEEAEIPIDYIAGTSMGAIVGGLYAIGYTTAQLDSMVRTQDWVALLSDKVHREDKLLAEKQISDTYMFSIPISLEKKFSIPSGVIAGQNVLNLLNEMTLGYHDEDLQFDSLPIPFACVAYDMAKGEEYVFREGNLPTAIRASMSIPGAFAPVLKDSMILVDGGIYNNLPTDVVRKMGADIVIASDVTSGKVDPERINTMMGLIDQITVIMGRDQYAKNKADVDLYIHPNVKPYTAASFTHEALDTLIARGHTAAAAKWDDIIALKEEICVDDACMFSLPKPYFDEIDSVMIGGITFWGLTRNEESAIRTSLGIRENSVVHRKKFNDEIGRLRGSGAFSYVTYTLESRPPYNLHISVDEKQQTSLNVGFRFDSEDMAAILLNTTLSFRGYAGPKIGITARLNDNPYVKLDFNTSNLLLGRLNLSYMFKSNNYKVYRDGKRTNNISCGQNRVDLYFSDINSRNYNYSLGIRYEYYNYSSFLYAGDRNFMEVKPEGFINYYVSGKFESFDDHYYPTRGYSFNVNGTLYTDNFYQYKKSAPFGSVSYDFRSAISLTHRRRLVIMPSLYGRTLIGKTVAYPYMNYMGGEIAGRYVDQQLPFVGSHHIEYFGNSVLAAALEVRMRLFSRHYVSVKGNFAIHNNNFFNMFTDRNNDVWGVGLKYSYNTPVGPVSIDFGYSDISKSFVAYFSFGKTF